MAPLQKFNATLQEYFHCLVGANIYLTPPNSQGFAPHYDDIEAFVLQIEGKKEWLLYPPRSDNETLPRESSGNFQPDEIGEPCFKQILEPGDLLYFPRGYIHQAKTVDNQHSWVFSLLWMIFLFRFSLHRVQENINMFILTSQRLHVTLSVYQKTSYADLLEEIMKQALKTAIDSTVSLRKGVPLDIWNQFGATYSEFDQESSRRRDVQNVISNMFKIVQKHVDLDDAVDKMAMKFQHDALPPVSTQWMIIIHLPSKKSSIQWFEPFLIFFTFNFVSPLFRSWIQRKRCEQHSERSQFCKQTVTSICHQWTMIPRFGSSAHTLLD